MPRTFILFLLSAAQLAAQVYSYDAAGRLTGVAYRQGGGVAYAYDDADNLISVTPLATAPAPTQVEVTRLSDTSARISWQGDPTATGYVVERRVVGAGPDAWEQVGSVPGGSNVFVDPNLSAGVDYEYRVRTVNDEGTSAPSKAATFGGPPTVSISQDGILNGAGFEVGAPIAPGSIVSVFGDNIGLRISDAGIGTILEVADEVPLSTELGGYTLLFGDVEAPLFFVGGSEAALTREGAEQGTIAGQINAQVPWELPLGQTSVRVRFQPEVGDEQESDPQTVSAALVSPAFFTFDFGPGRVAALNVKVSEDDGVTNGSIAQPAGDFPGSFSEPARLGGVVTLFANALGPTDPPAVTGQNSLDALRGATVPVRVFVGAAEAQVLFAGLTPQFVGLYQINIVVPLGAVPGDAVPIRIEQGGVMSRDDTTIAVRP